MIMVGPHGEFHKSHSREACNRPLNESRLIYNCREIKFQESCAHSIHKRIQLLCKKRIHDLILRNWAQKAPSMVNQKNGKGFILHSLFSVTGNGKEQNGHKVPKTWRQLVQHDKALIHKSTSNKIKLLNIQHPVVVQASSAQDIQTIPSCLKCMLDTRHTHIPIKIIWIMAHYGWSLEKWMLTGRSWPPSFSVEPKVFTRP